MLNNRRTTQRFSNCKFSTENVDQETIADRVQCERSGRILRSRLFDSYIVNASSWPLLVELFAAHLNETKMRTKELCAMSSLPQTTTLRYLDNLEKLDLVYREADQTDQRVTLVSLTELGASWIRKYYSSVHWRELRSFKKVDGYE